MRPGQLLAGLDGGALLVPGEEPLGRGVGSRIYTQRRRAWLPGRADAPDRAAWQGRRAARLGRTEPGVQTG